MESGDHTDFSSFSTRGTLPGCKVVAYEANHSLPSSVWWDHDSAPLICLRGMHRDNFPLSQKLECRTHSSDLQDYWLHNMVFYDNSLCLTEIVPVTVEGSIVH